MSVITVTKDNFQAEVLDSPKTVLLDFWASWCGPCKQEMPDFQEKYTELGDGVQFLMVNVTDGSRESVDSASAFIEEQGYTFPVFYDSSLEAVTEYSISGIPATFFIDADGVIAAHAVGSISSSVLQQGIDMIYAG